MVYQNIFPYITHPLAWIPSSLELSNARVPVHLYVWTAVTRSCEEAASGDQCLNVGAAACLSSNDSLAEGLFDKHSHLNREYRGKSSLRMTGANKAKLAGWCDCASMRALCCFPVFVCYFQFGLVGVQSDSILSIYMTEVLRWSCPMGSCNYSLLATE